ncbi:hypothetical protein MTR_5g055460 [Medicago truncatula]|uniref:MMS19 nucleotide excision repair protein n=1 Tax=Medicago truncatula TaxID=3880 RepID=G7JZH1_MEDTR|nr:hypothetical protein MTR_5g055460 [Medicago truncatula]
MEREDPLGLFSSSHCSFGICEAIDEEKEPECLMLVFHIVESLARLYPDLYGLLASFARDIDSLLCSSKYGSEKIAKYTDAILSSLKDTINTYLGGAVMVHKEILMHTA